MALTYKNGREEGSRQGLDALSLRRHASRRLAAQRYQDARLVRPSTLGSGEPDEGSRGCRARKARSKEGRGSRVRADWSDAGRRGLGGLRGGPRGKMEIGRAHV